MKVKKIVIPTLTLIIMASSLMGCASVDKEQVGDILSNSSSSVEIEVSEPVDSLGGDIDNNQSEAVSELAWTKLLFINKYNTLRKIVDSQLGIQDGKGSIYINLSGNQDVNNTLYNALRNKQFAGIQLQDEIILMNIKAGANSEFSDLEESDEFAAVINGYWDILPDASGEVTEFKGSSTLTRAQAMTLVMRAVTPVENGGVPKSNNSFTASVGESIYTDYASYVDSHSYLNSADNTLSSANFNGSMTRGEYVYLVLNTIFSADELSTIDISTVTLSDCTLNDTDNSDNKATNLANALQNPDSGLSADLYNAIAQANALKIIPSDTRWDEAITKTEAINIFVDTVQAYNEIYSYATDSDTPTENEALRERAKAEYAKVKDKVTCDENTYVDRFVWYVESGMEEDEAALEVYREFAKEQPNLEQVNVEKPSQSTQTPSSSSQKPGSSSQTPSSSSQKPSSSTQTPSSSTQTPSSSTQTPSSSTQKPSSSTQTPSQSTPTQSGEVNAKGEKAIDGHWVDKPGGRYWCENGNYYRSKDAWLNGESPVSMLEVDGVTMDDLGHIDFGF